MVADRDEQLRVVEALTNERNGLLARVIELEKQHEALERSEGRAVMHMGEARKRADELEALARSLEAERDADRANMATKSTELEKLVGEATANEALVEKKNLALIDAVKRPWVAAEQYHWGSGFNGLFNVARREAVDGPVTWEHYGSGGYEREHAEALVAKLNAQVIDSIEAMT